jgi:hypothetical protein
LVGLRARRARLRFTRQGEGSACGEGSKEAGGRKDQEKFRGWQEGAKAASRRSRQEATVAPGGPERTVLCVKVRVH